MYLHTQHMTILRPSSYVHPHYRAPHTLTLPHRPPPTHTNIHTTTLIPPTHTHPHQPPQPTTTHLHVWSSGSDSFDGVSADGVHLVTELLRLNGCHFLGLGDFQLILISDELVLRLTSSCQPLQLRFLQSSMVHVHRH